MTKQTAGPSGDFGAHHERARLVQRYNDATYLYNSTRDGRHLWRAFVLLHAAGEPMPPDLLDHFAQWAGRVLAADGPREIAAALELAGDDKSYLGRKASQAAKLRLDIARRVHTLRTFYGITATEAIADVARDRGLSVYKVKKAYHSTKFKTR